MDKLQEKSITTKRSFKYRYYTTPQGESTTKHPALFFIHGFPDSARMWQDVVAQLSDLPYKLIVPDTLGYGGTDKPTETKEYSYLGQADDLAEILDAEGVESAIIIGHDWGSAIAQRTFLLKRKYFSGIILLNVAYMLPSPTPFQLDAVNDFTEKIFGYPQYAYWELFTAPDAAEIINNNLERMWMVLHGDQDEWMRKMFCVKGAMLGFLLGDEEVPLKSYAKESRWKDAFMEQFKSDGFKAPLQMYNATAFNVQFEADKAISPEQLKITEPMLYIACTGDAVCVPQMMEPAKQAGLVPDLKQVTIESAHWVSMEKPDEVAKHIREFVTDRFP